MTAPAGYIPYVPDTEKYYKFFKLQTRGSLDPHISIMRGGAKSGMLSIDRSLELYDPTWKKVGGNKAQLPSINYVTDTQNVVERSKALLKREKNTIKERPRQRRVSRSRKLKRDTSRAQSKKRTKSKKRNKPKKKIPKRGKGVVKSRGKGIKSRGKGVKSRGGKSLRSKIDIFSRKTKKK
jgi:hypothetical protein